MNKEVLKEIILNIQDRTGIRNEILEKDYYVCEILKALSKKQDKLQAFFKGGTAVYKILDQMNRFSEDIDLTVKVNLNESNNSNRTRLKKSALDYDIDGLELIKEETVDKKGSITAFYKYSSVFDSNDLFKSGKIQIESTSFTVSEPVSKYTIEPLVYKYANDREKSVLNKNYGVSGFQIEIIKLGRIFVDKIFATEFYYEREMYNDVAKHLYDILVLIDNSEVSELLKNKNELLKMVNYKRKEEKNRLGGINENKKIKSFAYLNDSLSNEVTKAIDRMQKIYVLNDKYIIELDKIFKLLKTLKKLFSKYNM